MARKIAIYALCKNEIKNVEAWYESCRDADCIVVTDTGSTDGSRERLATLPLKVCDLRVLPWRFDDAFNAAMNNLPDDVDICIRLDFDERLQPGWRAGLEAAWEAETTRLRYPYVWNWNPDGTPDHQWMGDRIHARKNYRWSGATHEGLVCRGKEVTTWTTFVSIHQYPEIKDRPNDLPLLQESVTENPTDVRLWGYLAREYSYRGHFDECVKTYKHFLFLGGDPQERILAYQYIAKYSKDEAVEYLHKAMEEAPAYREPIVALAMHYYENGRWQECYDAAIKSLGLTLRPNSYICRSETWGALPHDLAAIAAWNLGMVDEAIKHAKVAAEMAPYDERLKSNVVFYTQKPLEAA